MGSQLMSWGLPVGRLFGISIKIHWILLLWWARDLTELLGQAADNPGLSRGQVFLVWVLTSGLGFLIILLHEFGHCFAARRVGGRADHVLLWPLGGLAYVDAPNHWRPRFVVAAGGPLVNVAILAIAGPLFWFTTEPTTPNAWLWYANAEGTLVRFNAFLLIFNLIPLWPLDGGRIFHNLTWGFYERRLGGDGYAAYFRATIVTIWTSRGVAVIGCIYGLIVTRIFYILIFVLSVFETENLRRRLVAGERPDTFFGHDFSQGYTSLEAGWSDGERARSRRRRGGGGLRGWWKRATAPKPLTPEESQRLDDLLRKISREGMGSLSRSERKFLERASRRRRR